MPIDKTKITNDMLAKAAKCQTADELIYLAKTERKSQKTKQRLIWLNWQTLN